jgi:hypothetical protein
LIFTNPGLTATDAGGGTSPRFLGVSVAENIHAENNELGSTHKIHELYTSSEIRTVIIDEINPACPAQTVMT